MTGRKTTARWMWGALFLALAATVSAQEASLLDGGKPAEAETPRTVALDTAPDAKIGDRLRQVLANIDGLDGLEVSVEDGVVTLRGTAAESAAKARAGEIAERFEGVVFVDNRIERETRLSWRLEQALGKLAHYGGRLLRMAPVLVLAALVIAISFALARLVHAWDAPWRLLGISPLVRGLVQRLLFATVAVAGIVLALDLLDVAAIAGATLGAAGLVGIALGFAFRDIVENYLAGILLSLRHPFALGDLVRIGEHEGKVLRLNSRELILITLDGNHVRIPNSTVFKQVLVNYTHNPKRRFVFDIGIGTEEPVGETLKVARRAMAETPGVLGDPPPYALVDSLGDSTVLVRCFGWMHQGEADFFKVRGAAIQAVFRSLAEAGIEMPEPIHQIRLRRPTAGRKREETPVAAPRSEEPGDVAPTGELDQQIAEDLRESDEENVLERE